MIEAIAALLEHDTAGDPITGIKWSRRTTAKIADPLRQQFRIDLSPNTVARLLRQMDYSLRLNQKRLAANSSPHRNSTTSLSCAYAFLAAISPSLASIPKSVNRLVTSKTPAVVGIALPGPSMIMTSAQIPKASPSPTASTTSVLIEAPSS